MKIAFFSDCYLDLTGGIVSSINAQKTALEAMGHTVYIFSTGFPRSKSQLAELATKNIFLVPSCKLFFRGLTPVSRRPKIIERWLLKNHPELKTFDIFYVHYEAGCSIAALRLAKTLKIPSVQVMHGREDMGETNLIPFGLRTLVAYLLNLLHSWYLPHKVTVSRDHYLANNLAKAKMWTLMVNHANSADLVLSPSAHFKDKLTHYGVKTEVKVLENAYPDAKFPENPPLKTLKQGQTLRIIWHSRVSAEKRIMPFLRALNLLNQTNSNFSLDVYGGGGDFFRAKRFARRHHLPVIFHGNAPFEDIQKSLQSAHLDVLVSYNFDTFGMTLIEAEAYNTPVFICDPDMQEVVPKGSFILSPGPSPEQMAASLARLLNSPENIAKMSKIMQNHRTEILASTRIKKLEQIFSDIIKK